MQSQIFKCKIVPYEAANAGSLAANAGSLTASVGIESYWALNCWDRNISPKL
jgi:hypothetical protein